ncbi:chemotaxis protein CheX [Rhodopirellula europaea]|uniref:Chemotaxis phosphatase CheX-like domain-containing protein n=1 Tax=Rhodopirellula europaea 6C TaxID=1263867 RepID=M2AAN0_9BACT|nr:chemotaxis protein CheX [Rhodopirellula europaea]EMB13605.1 hypothetical protein RE6C_05695 [Rhodopirellula europaea 6C]
MRTQLSTEETLQEDFWESFSELIQCYQNEPPKIERCLDDEIEANMTSIIGLSCPEFSASVALVTSADAALKLANVTPECIPDWLGELANQLGGRFKNKLANYGVLPHLSTPTTVEGRYIQLSSTSAKTFALTAHFDGGSAIAQITLKIDDDLELNECESTPASEEGSLELF